jgi:flagellin
MAFRINSNIEALGAYNNLSTSSMGLSSQIQKLSSGMRINGAGDDPAGLIAAELFRSQVNSIEAATRNNQDAINYSKTAETALGEVNRLLNEARGLAIASGNTATLSAAQIQANQDQLNSIASAITRVSSNTQYGTRRLLDGSSGVQGQISNATRVQGLTMIGTWRGASITAGSLITIVSSNAGTRATFPSSALTGGNVLAGGSFAINGTTFNVPAGTAGTSVASQINGLSSQTGVTANFNAATNILSLSAVNVGSNSKITFTDPNGVLVTPVGTAVSIIGTDATATLSIGTPAVSTMFTGGKNGTDGLFLTDLDGNSVRFPESGNVTSAVATTVGRVDAGIASFQIGANANQTTQLSLPNVNSTQLGAGVVLGTSMANLDVSTSTGATAALLVIDRAIEQVSSSRGRIGQFTKFTLDSNNRSLGTAKENMSAAESSIRDADVAAEMTNYTKYQVMQQAGLSILAQANQLPQNVLGLIRGQ